MYDQVNSPIDRISASFTSDYHLNQTIIGFIDANDIPRLINLSSNPYLHHLQRKHISFDPAIFLLITLVLIAMVVGNEWHRKIFIEKILQHSHSTRTMKVKWGFIIGLLLFLAFILFYLVNRYATFINGEIYPMILMTLSTLMIYLCLKESSYLIMKIFFSSNSAYSWWHGILLLVSFLIVILWFCRKLIYIQWILTDFITFCLTVVIVAQMRVGNLMICTIILSFVWLFECLLWIGKLSWASEWNKKSELSITIEERISRIYMNVVENILSDPRSNCNKFSCTMMKIWIIG